ncbi:methyltransferase domain-containing protein [Chitinophaga sp. 22321]|uniref:Methyltransferase domain-containing protein n=1 Tax=Chitinophaga hostae TaxID=2831022 RepID=A0ABS5JA63_9BACT|nr:methyltransferase domain-containing protein [Chitinophaga hostae]MBS0031986.1 methyltransferase domain-containing protein [Chitinophaga hostae]
MRINTRQRSQAPEIMDDFNMEGELLKETLKKIAQINRLLGGNRITRKGVAALIKNIPAGQPISILDVGCGNGDMLRELSAYGKKQQRNFLLTGVDANLTTVTHARELSKEYPDIAYHCQDIMSPAFGEQHYDIILCTLTLHHFKEAEIRQLMAAFRRQARIGIVINDLHRSALAVRLFQLVCFVFNLNSMVRADGQVSILRGFKKKELHHLSAELNIGAYSLQWKWAFRYQWIINNI